MIRFSFYLLALTFTCSFKLEAQQPAYFLFGEEQFRGVDIYDIIQDNDLNYWFATNKGIYVYDYYKYEKISCPEAKSLSVFNFVKDQDGIIYCHNLNNQIFKIEERKLSVFFELSLEESSSDISLLITTKNNLMVQHKGASIINKKGEVILKYGPSFHSPYNPFKLKPNFIISHLNNSDSLLVCNGKEFYIVPIVGSAYKPSTLDFFSIDDKFYALDKKLGVLYSFNETSFELKKIAEPDFLKRNDYIRLYHTKKHLWIAGTMSGVTLVSDLKTTFTAASFLNDVLISDVYWDHEGNILLGTFDKGVVVIPNLEATNIVELLKETKASSITAASHSIYIGSRNGNLFKYDGASALISKAGSRYIDKLFSNSSSPFIVFDDGIIKVYDSENDRIFEVSKAALKDVFFSSKNVFYIATNSGVEKVTWKNNSFNVAKITDHEIRANLIGGIDNTNEVYVATSDGLKQIIGDSLLRTVYYSSEKIYANCILSQKEKVILSTKNNKLIEISNGKIIKSNPVKLFGKEIELQKFLKYKHTLIANSDLGLIQLDTNANFIKKMDASIGVTSNKVTDFTIHKELLWIVNSENVQQFYLHKLNEKIDAPKIKLASIFVNDSTYNNSRQSGFFESNQRKFQFDFSVPTLKHQKNTLYHYKLLGYDKDWITSSYNNNTVTYNALEPGNYTFYLRASNQGINSNITSFTFNIANPYYASWWFYVFLLTLFLIMFAYIFKKRLEVQQKKANLINELNATKLTAIQSQMNPHFIFNALNSIQDLVLKGDVDNSYKFITTFSNLVRKTLNYSAKDFIEFEQEINLLDLYLSLEKLRFKDNLEYTINTNGIEDVEIPPMLIQPFIENSLLHGLLHKDGIKKLTISFFMNDVLICEVVDNGIGRQKALEIKSRQKNKYESFSGNAIKKRFEILEMLHKNKLGYTYQDLYEKEAPIGTKVILKIPVKRKF